jgi:hypothetical protein
VKLSYFNDKFDSSPQNLELDFSELPAALQEIASDDKATAPLWSPALMVEGKTVGHTKSVEALALDFDHETPPWDKLAGWTYFAHTTHSHTEADPHWRVVVELDEPGDAASWKNRFKAKMLMHGFEMDSSCCNPNRSFFVPPTSAQWKVNEGRPACMPTPEMVNAVERDQTDLAANDDGLLSDGSLFWPDVVRMMKSLPASIEGQGGDDRLFEAACVCRSSFRLTPEACFRALQVFNERAQPPWDDDRLWYKIEQAAGDRQHPAGELVPAAARAELQKGWTPPAEPEEPPVYEHPFRLISAAQLAEPLGPVAWLVRDLGLAPGRPCVINGYAGSGKTFAAQEIALSVASGESAFGRMQVRQGSVLHIDVDQGRRATASRYQQLARGRGMVLANQPIDLMVFQGYLTSGGEINREAVQSLGNACVGRALCVIDSLRGIAPDMDENSSEFGSVLQMLAEISNATEEACGLGCCFIVLHHEGKPQQGSARGNKHSGRGSSAIQDRAGAVWRLVPLDDDTKQVEWSMSKISEHDTEFCKPFTTKFVPVEGGGAILRAAGAETRSDAPKQNVTRIGTDLCAKLRKADRWMSRSELLTDVSGKNADKAEALSHLRKAERIAYKLDGTGHFYHWNPKMDPRA